MPYTPGVASSFSWHGSWRRRTAGEGLGIVEQVRLGVSDERTPAPEPARTAPARWTSQVSVVPLSQDVPGPPGARPCGRMWLGG